MNNDTSLYGKLQLARVKLMGTSITKSGFNKFNNFKYFELGDFLPPIQKIFNEVGLTSNVTFSNELATLSIICTDTGNKIDFTCPFVMSELKGANAMQNLGSSITYLRRYLWVTAMEIVENDVHDSQDLRK